MFKVSSIYCQKETVKQNIIYETFNENNTHLWVGELVTAI